MKYSSFFSSLKNGVEFFIDLSKELPDEDRITAWLSTQHRPTLVKSMYLWISAIIYSPTSSNISVLSLTAVCTSKWFSLYKLFLFWSYEIVLLAYITASISVSALLWYFLAHLSALMNWLSVIDGQKFTIFNVRKDNCFLFSILLKQLMTTFMLLHWFTSALHWYVNFLDTVFADIADFRFCCVDKVASGVPSRVLSVVFCDNKCRVWLWAWQMIFYLMPSWCFSAFWGNSIKDVVCNAAVD